MCLLITENYEIISNIDFHLTKSKLMKKLGRAHECCESLKQTLEDQTHIPTLTRARMEQYLSEVYSEENLEDKAELHLNKAYKLYCNCYEMQPNDIYVLTSLGICSMNLKHD